MINDRKCEKLHKYNMNFYYKNIKLKNEIKKIRSIIRSIYRNIIWSIEKIHKIILQYKKKYSMLSTKMEEIESNVKDAEQIKKIISQINTMAKIPPQGDLLRDLSAIKDKISENTKSTAIVNSLSHDPIKVLHDKLFQIPNHFMFALDLTSHEETKFLGLSLMASRAVKVKLYKVASDYLLDVPISFIAKYNSLTAAIALSREDQGRFISLVDYLLHSNELVQLNTVAECCFALLHFNDKIRVDNLIRKYKKSISGANTIEKIVFHSIIKELEPDNRDTSKKEAVNIGILSYNLPGRLISANIGDYFQTIALLGQMFKAGMRSPENSTIPMLSTLAAKVDVEDPAKSKEVNFVVCERDHLGKVAYANPVWITIVGWMAHMLYDREIEFNFSENVYPLFISIHLARSSVLTDNNLAILKKCEPIGCRDYNTVRILRSHNIRAFFSGCITSTLDILYSREDISDLSYASAHHQKDISPYASEIFINHTSYNLLIDNFNTSLDVCNSVLNKYADAKKVRTSLLHCYMPCRSMGVPVKWTHKLPSDRRFEGLIGISKAELVSMKSRFSHLREIFAMILEEIQPSTVYERWKTIWQEEEDATTRYLEAAVVELPPLQYRAGTLARQIDKHFVGNPEKNPSAVQVVFAADKPYAKQLLISAAGLLANSSKPVFLHILGRQLSPADLSELLSSEKLAGAILYDCGKVDYGGLRLLNHTSISTMDRLLIPELLAEYDKAIYLDADILVRGDIKNLWSFNIDSHLLGARPSIHDEWMNGLSLSMEIAERYNYTQATSLRNHLYHTGPLSFPCFNAGVLVMNLKKMREVKALEYTLKLAHEYGLHDQFCLNILTRGDYLSIPPQWNHFYNQETLANPHIVHYIGPWKPWDFPQLPWASEWRKHMDACCSNGNGA